MSMFNEEQRDYMRYLSTVDPANLCWCGWFHYGECPHCQLGVTAADKLKVRCGECGNSPIGPGGRLIHIIGCVNAK